MAAMLASPVSTVTSTLPHMMDENHVSELFTACIGGIMSWFTYQIETAVNEPFTGKPLRPQEVYDSLQQFMAGTLHSLNNIPIGEWPSVQEIALASADPMSALASGVTFVTSKSGLQPVRDVHAYVGSVSAVMLLHDAYTQTQVSVSMGLYKAAVGSVVQVIKDSYGRLVTPDQRWRLHFASNLTRLFRLPIPKLSDTQCRSMLRDRLLAAIQMTSDRFPDQRLQLEALVTASFGPFDRASLAAASLNNLQARLKALQRSFQCHDARDAMVAAVEAHMSSRLAAAEEEHRRAQAAAWNVMNDNLRRLDTTAEQPVATTPLDKDWYNAVRLLAEHMKWARRVHYCREWCRELIEYCAGVLGVDLQKWSIGVNRVDVDAPIKPTPPPPHGHAPPAAAGGMKQLDGISTILFPKATTIA